MYKSTLFYNCLQDIHAVGLWHVGCGMWFTLMKMLNQRLKFKC